MTGVQTCALPICRWVSFVRNYDLWVVNVAAGEAKQLTHGGREELMNGQLDWVYPEEDRKSVV